MILETIWFALVGCMLAVYVVLDGFDFGAGILHLFVARTDAERRVVLRTVGPVWDANEVWLIAAGGTLFMAFPRMYAVSFCGFYLPLMIILWLLVFRALGIELRHQLEHPLWKQFWDVAFAGSSLLLAIFFGAAFGNVLRGVSLDESGQFFAPLWTNFLVGEHTGILDWYTIIVAVTVAVALAMHGGLWLAWRTENVMRARADRIIRGLWPALMLCTALTMLITLWVQRQVVDNLDIYRWGVVFPLAAMLGLGAVPILLRRGERRRAFLASCVYLVGMLASAAFSIYPSVLPARIPANSLTIANTAADPYGLTVALYWWIPSILLVCGYAYFLYSRLPATLSAGEADGH